ncbi:MAG TPA: polyphenol oxidase family protein [Nocardioides sp.]
MFAHRETRAGGAGRARAQFAFTDVHLDLAESAVGLDDSLAYLEESLGVRIARMHQVHGGDVAVGDPAAVPEADGLVTDRPGVALLVRVADCVPVLLADPAAAVVGVAHAGRKGMALGVVTHTVERMRALGADAITAWIGPHICGRCYEVPEEMRAEVAATVPASYAETRWGTPGLDLGAGVAAQLEEAGCEVLRLDRCTLEHAQLLSYRRDGVASGRCGGLVWIEA